MRILIQRVARASVSVAGKTTGRIGPGLLVLVGITEDDTPADADYLAGKTVRLRIFDDEEGIMNRDLTTAGGEVLVVSQFTLYASTRRGNRPSYIRAAGEATARPLYERYVAALAEMLGHPVPTGIFGADMQIELINDGPVTIWIDSRQRDY